MSSPAAAWSTPLPGREYAVRDIALTVGFAGASALLMVLAALGVPPFAGGLVIPVLGLALVGGVHLCFGALVTGAGVEIVHGERSRLDRLDYVQMAFSLTAIVAAEVALARFLLHHLHGRLWWAYLVFALVLAVAGGLWAGLRAWPGARRPTDPPGTPETPGEELERSPGIGILSALIGLGVGAAVAVVGIAGSAFYRSQYVAPRVPPPTVAAVEGITGSYVALGDSYSAGEGLRPFLPGTTKTGCHRSNQAYSQRLMFDPDDVDRVFRACSGAVIADLYAPRDSKVPVEPQVDGAVHPEVGLVTLTIGGNNALFSKIVVSCFNASNCLTADFPGRGKKGPDGIPSGPLAKTWAPQTALRIGEKDAELFGRLRETYPNARIVVLGYPYLFPEGRAGFVPDDCASILRRFSRKERLGIRHLQKQFNDLIYERAVEAGIEFVSPAAIWKGHEPCGSEGQYTNSIKPFLNFKSPVDGGTFHPNRDGQQTLAALVSCYLRSHPEPPDPFVDGRPPDFQVSSTRLQTPAELGLVDAPGATSLPSACR